ncbi:MAG: HAMP domain-containing histidine kinase [Bacteroidia bacterium]|nr:HAMP domain-containing histidine kinase [Bacteroidia bacterium]
MGIAEIIETYREVLYPAVLNSTSFCLAIFNAGGEISFCNPGFRLLFRNRPSIQYASPDIPGLLKSSRDSVLYTGKISFYEPGEIGLTIEGTIQKAGNIYILFGSVNNADLRESNHQIAAQNREINNLQRELVLKNKKLEHTLNTLKNMQAMLVHSEKMNSLGQLVAGIAHEINNPLSFISSNIHTISLDFSDLSLTLQTIENQAKNYTGLSSALQQIKEEYRTQLALDEFEEVIAGATEGIRRIQKIIADLNHFSRKNQAEYKRIDIIENINSTLSILHAELQKRNIKIEITPTSPLFFTCYPAELNQALMNILLNAVAAIDNHGTIAIHCTLSDPHLQISIADNGCGIPESARDKIFDPFFTTKEPGKGTGLGLSITHSIITELHQGEISFTTEFNKGTCFTIQLPNTKK